MPLRITQDCVNCAACADVCPNDGIRPGKSAYVIDLSHCTECVGFHPVEQCVEICPADCVVTDPRAVMTERELFQRALAIHANSGLKPVLTPKTSHFTRRSGRGAGSGGTGEGPAEAGRSGLATAPLDAEESGVRSSPARRWVSFGALLVVPAIWVLSAWRGAEYLVSSLDAVNLERKIGSPVALTIFLLSTTVLWLGLVVGAMVIAWKRWPQVETEKVDSPGGVSPDH